MKLHSRGFHSLFPHGVTCVLPDQTELDAVLGELAQAGFGAARTVVLSGQPGLHWLDADGTHHGRRARFIRKLQRMCSEGEEELLNRVQTALVAGHPVVIVMTHGKPSEREIVRAIARKHTREPLFYCGTLAIEELPV